MPSQEQVLRSHNLHVTVQRLTVLRVVDENPHAAAEEVAQLVRAEIGTISRQTVYDTLAALTARGIVRRIQPSGSPARYETRVGDNHHHLVCRTCDRLVDVDCAVGERPCLTAADAQGFDIDEAEVIYWGICPSCQPAQVAGGERSEGQLDVQQLSPQRKGASRG